MSQLTEFAQIREKTDLSIEEVAERLRVNKKAVYRWEKGDTKPGKVVLMMLERMPKKSGTCRKIESIVKKAKARKKTKRIQNDTKADTLTKFISSSNKRFHLACGDCLEVLRTMPSNSIDCVMTSPPYWQQREYHRNKLDLRISIGNEASPSDYVSNLVIIFDEIKRVLKPKGSFWLNLGDKYYKKNLMGMPWRVALAMQDRGWILRNDIIWDQIKGTQSAQDRMRDVYEHVFHFVKSHKYYYMADRIRIKPTAVAKDVNGVMVSATGVSGRKYFKQIDETDALTAAQKSAARKALQEVIGQMRAGDVVDFRMTIKGNQRTFHSDNGKVSGRAKELETKGFYILKMKSKGFLPSDIWRIVPEDKNRKDEHYAVFPEALLSIPLRATCPLSGIVLDPFLGTGSAITAALKLGMRGIGIELSKKYHRIAAQRIESVANQALQLLPNFD